MITISPSPPEEVMMWITVLIQMLPFLIVTIIGLLTYDVYADKKKATETGDAEAYELSWKEVILYGSGATILTMASLGALLNDLMNNVWAAMTIAWIMGLAFRMILPKLVEIAGMKAEAILQAIFK